MVSHVICHNDDGGRYRVREGLSSEDQEHWKSP